LAYLASVLKDRLELSYVFGLQKYFPSEKARGFREAESDEGGLPLCISRARAGADAACGSGGPMNDNWLLINGLEATYYFLPELWLTASLTLLNYFRFAVPDDAVADPSLPEAGRADYTWGIIELAYQLQDHLVLAFGTSSLQPALNADNSAPRFPFWDFVSPSNNFSKLYLTATAVY